MVRSDVGQEDRWKTGKMRTITILNSMGWISDFDSYGVLDSNLDSDC